ncbi:glycosyltransferase [Apibacter muscae]|uniref:glycosyltransferase family 2 protein n=1 Tax=Apibacter muscae TaxID=2509004 RepID=UPI0011AC829A|nr:glycosyltransferase family 2 protein [Apibacter muscae]TWP31192.1 glycosyltransferase [Apibacter muscae]
MQKLAIIIPYYKIDFFERTLQSLNKQTNKEFTVYIGNDNSPDDPQLIIDKFSTNNNIIYKKFDNNLGGIDLVKQWDRCIQLSNEEPWIMILGDDDTLSENCIEEFYKSLPEIQKDNISVVKFSTIEIDENDNPISEKYEHPTKELSTSAYVRKIKGETRSSLIEYIFSREKYLKYGFKNFPLAFGSDNLAWIEFSECGDIYSINDAVVYFRMSKSSISGNKNIGMKEKTKAMYLTKKYIIKNYFSYFTKDQRRDILKRAYKELVWSDNKNYVERMWIILLMIKHISIQEIKEYL